MAFEVSNLSEYIKQEAQWAQGEAGTSLTASFERKTGMASGNQPGANGLCIALSSDDNIVAVGSASARSGHFLRLYTVAFGTDGNPTGALTPISNPAESQPGPVYALKFSKDNKFLFVGHEAGATSATPYPVFMVYAISGTYPNYVFTKVNGWTISKPGTSSIRQRCTGIALSFLEGYIGLTYRCAPYFELLEIEKNDTLSPFTVMAVGSGSGTNVGIDREALCIDIGSNTHPELVSRGNPDDDNDPDEWEEVVDEEFLAVGCASATSSVGTLHLFELAGHTLTRKAPQPTYFVNNALPNNACTAVRFSKGAIYFVASFNTKADTTSKSALRRPSMRLVPYKRKDGWFEPLMRVRGTSNADKVVTLNPTSVPPSKVNGFWFSEDCSLLFVATDHGSSSRLMIFNIMDGEFSRLANPNAMPFGAAKDVVLSSDRRLCITANSGAANSTTTQSFTAYIAAVEWAFERLVFSNGSRSTKWAIDIIPSVTPAQSGTSIRQPIPKLPLGVRASCISAIAIVGSVTPTTRNVNIGSIKNPTDLIDGEFYASLGYTASSTAGSSSRLNTLRNRIKHYHLEFDGTWPEGGFAYTDPDDIEDEDETELP